MEEKAVNDIITKYGIGSDDIRILMEQLRENYREPLGLSHEDKQNNRGDSI